MGYSPINDTPFLSTDHTVILIHLGIGKKIREPMAAIRDPQNLAAGRKQ
jgi:hypothetical protein